MVLPPPGETRSLSRARNQSPRPFNLDRTRQPENSSWPALRCRSSERLPPEGGSVSGGPETLHLLPAAQHLANTKTAINDNKRRRLKMTVVTYIQHIYLSALTVRLPLICINFFPNQFGTTVCQNRMGGGDILQRAHRVVRWSGGCVGYRAGSAPADSSGAWWESRQRSWRGSSHSWLLPYSFQLSALPLS